MGRTKIAGIQATGEGYNVDKWFHKRRIRQDGFTDFESAQAFLDRAVEQIRTEENSQQRKDPTFEEAAQHYLTIYHNKVSLESEIYHLKAIMPYIEQDRLSRIHNGSLERFKTARKAQGIKCKTINLSLAMVRRILNLAARDWRDAHGNTWLATAPMITLLPLTDQRPPRPIMWEEQRRLLPNLPDHLAGMALFVLNTGARDNVVCNLRWEWELPIDQLDTSVFIVPKEFVKGRKADKVLVCNTVAMSVINSLRGNGSKHVFTWRKKPIGTMNNTAWQNGRAKAGLGDLHVHDLRHTTGLRLREAGIPDRTQDDILWHSNKTMTSHYSMGQIVEIYEALEKIKDESNGWNLSLASLIRQRDFLQVTEKSPLKMKMG